MKHTTATGAVAKRQRKEKKRVVEQLEKTPIIQIACEKTGVARSTYYRWTVEDPAFAKQTRKAIQQGVSLMNDLAESRLLACVKDGNLSAITFWLRSRHTAYGNRVEVVETDTREDLTSEQKKLVRRILKAYTSLP